MAIPPDPEVEAIAVSFAVLEALPRDARERALLYLHRASGGAAAPLVESTLREERDQLKARVAELEEENRDARRICDTPGCLAAIIKNSMTGNRQCAAGHGFKWITASERDALTKQLEAANARAEAWREAAEALEIAYNGEPIPGDLPLIDYARALDSAAESASGKEGV